ncbi:hypothetical protein TSUD_192140 [Trifolium subterraneum]|uniref:Calmodulin-lysine N-methyltransferase n=1 Tax=Trifolium subterraneum TaxID=3900 RepID=A0A2Z6PTF2_TRISU|nr:hypothetical protein TSUD_192140 [Trifolium subterraneum]
MASPEQSSRTCLKMAATVLRSQHCLSHEGNWPSEDVLAHYCFSHRDIFRSKKVIELGSGYGLAGFVIAAVTEASEVVISDGNPQVVDYTQRNIEANSGAFGDTVVKSMMLHWNQEDTSSVADTFDIIVASDCTFFKDFHRDLVRTVKHLLSKTESSQALFLSPKRGNSLDLFLEVAEENGLHFTVTENYDKEVWKRHEGFLNGSDKDSWPSYETDSTILIHEGSNECEADAAIHVKSDD